MATRVVKDTDSAVGFIDAGGWSNMAYCVDARVLTSKRVKVGVAVIFDGDYLEF